MSVLSSLKPAKVFHYFEEICNIPHGSGNTLAISNYLVNFATGHNLKYIQDASNNVIIFAEGSKGYENSAPVMLQGHIDMVTVKEKGCDIDLEKEGLRLILNDKTITADGTSLGGDDGIAVAYALAIMDSPDIPHPPIEAVFTVDEEIGMLGAASLDCSPLKSRTMLNIDSEDEGYLLVSCAGGAGATCTFCTTSETVLATATMIEITITGASGGHSGVEIVKQGANSSKVLGRFLYALKKLFPVRLCTITGGSKDNAIPVSATAKIIIEDTPADVMPALEQLTQNFNRILQHEYNVTDPDICISYTRCEENITMDSKGRSAFSAMSIKDTDTIITALFCFPNGVQKMSTDLEGLVQTSLNLGIMKTTGTTVSFTFSVRSSIASEKECLIDRLRCLTEALGGTFFTNGDYPAWEYRKDSPLRDLMVEVFKEQYGHAPVIQALHAGVECGVFSSKIPELDCVSFGPDMKDIHTTSESMDIDSVKRTWDYLLEILRRLK